MHAPVSSRLPRSALLAVAVSSLLAVSCSDRATPAATPTSPVPSSATSPVLSSATSPVGAATPPRVSTVEPETPADLAGTRPAPPSSPPAGTSAATPVAGPSASPAGSGASPATTPGTGPGGDLRSVAAPPVEAGSVIGEPAIHAGALTPNPGGAPDLHPDPGAGITGDPPHLDLPPADPALRMPDDASESRRIAGAYADATNLAGMVRGERSSDGMAVVPQGVDPSPARFADPCAAGGADGCPAGVGADVLGPLRSAVRDSRIRPPLSLFEFKRITAGDPLVGECRRQLPGLDVSASLVLAAVLNVPVPQADLQLHQHRFQTGFDTGTGPVVRSFGGRTSPSADLAGAWATRFDLGGLTPRIPLCMQVPYVALDQGLPICLVRCYSALTTEVSGQLEDGTPFAFSGSVPSYDPDPAHDLFRHDVGAVIVPITRSTVEVRASYDPVVADTANRDTVAMVAAAGYPGGTDCRAADPAAGLVLNPLPISRQPSATRYATDGPTPTQRTAVIPLTLPTVLAPDESISICVWWYAFGEQSWSRPIVRKIERHTLVPPTSAATQVRFLARYSPNIPGERSAPVTPAALADLQFAFLTSPELNRICGFSARRSPDDPVVLRPADDPGLLCEISDQRYAETPGDETLYVGYYPPGLPEGESGVVVEGRAQVPLDNRGCVPSGCGSPRVITVPMRDGTMVDVLLTKVPAAHGSVVGGATVNGGGPDRWLIDPAGADSQAPTLRTDPTSAAPQLDTASLRVTQNAADPQTALDVTWWSDRPVRATVMADAASPGSQSACPHTWREGSTLQSGDAPVTTTIRLLCADTNYVISLVLTAEPDGSGVAHTATFRWNAGPLNALRGRTAARPAPPDFDYAYRLAVVRVGSSGPPTGEIRTAELDLNGLTLGRQVRSGGCVVLGPDQTVLAGDRGADPILGDVRVLIDVTVGPASAGGCPDGAALGEVHRFLLTTFIRWDGLAERVFPITAPDGSEFRLTLRPLRD